MYSIQIHRVRNSIFGHSKAELLLSGLLRVNLKFIPQSRSGWLHKSKNSSIKFQDGSLHLMIKESTLYRRCSDHNHTDLNGLHFHHKIFLSIFSDVKIMVHLPLSLNNFQIISSTEISLRHSSEQRLSNQQKWPLLI